MLLLLFLLLLWWWLQDTYGGFLDYQLSDDFVYYADLAFQHLGPYVKHWLTFSEPMSICQLGYGVGIYAPGVERGSYGQYRSGYLPTHCCSCCCCNLQRHSLHGWPAEACQGRNTRAPQGALICTLKLPCLTLTSCTTGPYRHPPPWFV